MNIQIHVLKHNRNPTIYILVYNLPLYLIYLGIFHISPLKIYFILSCMHYML